MIHYYTKSFNEHRNRQNASRGLNRNRGCNLVKNRGMLRVAGASKICSDRRSVTCKPIIVSPVHIFTYEK